MYPDVERSTFMFDAQTVKPLYTVASQCPRITLRCQAISMLMSSPRREGFWNSVLCGTVAQWVLGIEKEDTDDDYILEETKIQNSAVEANLQKRTAHIQCLKPDKKIPRRLISRSVIITW